MKYFSEVTKKLYESEEALKAAENEVSVKEEIQKLRHEEVAKAYEQYVEAGKTFFEMRKAYNKDFGKFTIKAPFGSLTEADIITLDLAESICEDIFKLR